MMTEKQRAARYHNFMKRILCMIKKQLINAARKDDKLTNSEMLHINMIMQLIRDLLKDWK